MHHHPGTTLDALVSTTGIGPQTVSLCAAFVLCLLLGLERHLHLKDAGIKTHVLVGLGACLFTLVSAYGFSTGAGGAHPDGSCRRVVVVATTGPGPGRRCGQNRVVAGCRGRDGGVHRLTHVFAPGRLSAYPWDHGPVTAPRPRD